MRTSRRRSHFGLLPLIVLSMVVGRVLAEPLLPPGRKPEVSFQEHVHRDFFVRDGLPSNWINDIARTRDGFVWLATDNGLARYDGFGNSETAIRPTFKTRNTATFQTGRSRSDSPSGVKTAALMIRYAA